MIIELKTWYDESFRFEWKKMSDYWKKCLIIVNLSVDWTTFVVCNVWFDNKLTWNVQIEIKISDWRVVENYWRENRFTNLWVVISSKSWISRSIKLNCKNFESNENIESEYRKLHAKHWKKWRIVSRWASYEFRFS